MQFGIVISAGRPREAAELAAEAEAAGWDGVFTWDGIAIGWLSVGEPKPAMYEMLDHNIRPLFFIAFITFVDYIVVIPLLRLITKLG